MRILGALLAVTFGFLVTSCSTLRSAPVAERIVFVSTRTGNGDLYIANADGSSVRRLTSDDRPELLPRCSPDGRYLAFVRGTTAAGDLFKLDLRDGTEVRLTNDPTRDSTPEWSPDGRRIYFTKRDGRHDRIAVVNADGSGLTYLTDGTSHDVMPGVSPSGRHIVHHSYRYGKETELHLIDLKNGASRRLTQATGSDYEASFAGGGMIVFSSNRGGGHHRLYRQSLNSGAVHLLADTGADAWAGRYSAKQRAVLFHTGKPGAWRLMTVSIHGGTPKAILPDGYSNLMADWC